MSELPRDHTPMYLPTELEGVYLREIIPEDAHALARLTFEGERPHVREGILNPPHPLRLSLGIWRETPVERVRELVGFVSVTPTEPAEAQVCVAVGQAFLRHGYATCALRTLIRHCMRSRPYSVLSACATTAALEGVLKRAGLHKVGESVGESGGGATFERALHPRGAIPCIVKELEVAGYVYDVCVPCEGGYPHHTKIALIKSMARVEIFPPANAALMTSAYRELLKDELTQEGLELV